MRKRAKVTGSTCCSPGTYRMCDRCEMKMQPEACLRVRVRVREHLKKAVRAKTGINLARSLSLGRVRVRMRVIGREPLASQ